MFDNTPTWLLTIYAFALVAVGFIALYFFINKITKK
jgi:hypothetical protein